MELLIAISIFSVMATLAYGGLKQIIDGNRQLEQSAAGLASLQRTFLFIQQDLEQAVPRGVRDELGSQQDALIGGAGEKLLYLTRGGGSGEISGKSDLSRVEYHLNDGHLERLVWSVLDRVQGSELSRIRLINDVQSIEMDFIGHEQSDWHGFWPPEAAETTQDVLPRAVEVIITTKEFGRVKRLFVIGS